jgi:hypothetical protein
MPSSSIVFPLEHVIHPAAAAGEDSDGLSTTVGVINNLWQQWQLGGSGAEGADRWWGRAGTLGGRAAPPGDGWWRGRATRLAAAAATEYFWLFIWGRREFLRGRATRLAAAAATMYFWLFIWGRREFLTLS